MKRIIVILLAVVLSVPAFAQGKYGKDSVECIKYLSYYSELVKQNNLDDAAPYWRKAFSLCPAKASQNMFIHGQKIIRYEIKKNSKDPQRVAQLVDTLFLLHDLRAENFPKNYVKSLDSKAIDYVNYVNDPAKQYATLTDIISKIGSEASPIVFVKQMQAAMALFKDGKLDADAIMDNYSTISAYMDAKIAAGSGEMAGAKQDVETLFADSGVASCDNLVALFTPRFQANPTDKASLSGMVKLLAKSECVNTELFLQTVEALSKIDPSASSSYYLYKLYSSHDENAKAAESLEQAISQLTEEEGALKAEYSFELATFYFKKCGKNAAAVEKAKAVAELDPSYAGRAYLLIGTIWGSTKCSGNEVEVRAPFWVAADYMAKAKNADPSLEEEANTLLAQYRRYFPNQADAFMYDVIDGNSYTVSCGGMRESTIVRTNK
ncbi:MAG: hypothetical protein KBT00_06780 [Bacteroidales bacterium]|nr:hypothetical protein [Candidatus Cacconaster merdequi]